MPYILMHLLSVLMISNPADGGAYHARRLCCPLSFIQILKALNGFYYVEMSF